MSILRLLSRTPSAKPLTRAVLDCHSLRFHKISEDGSGKCDAYYTGDPNHLIVGVVFTISVSEKRTLDLIEGLGSGYEEKEVELITPKDQVLKALTYYASHIDAALKPYQWYKHHVLTGAKENSLPEDYVKQIEKIVAIDDPLKERYKLEMAIYTGK